jgi:hypothetical protein
MILFDVMKKIMLIFIALYIFCSCDGDNDTSNPTPFLTDYSKIEKILTLKNDHHDTIYQKEFLLDQFGRVYEYNFYNPDYPENKFKTTFTYDDQHRLLEQHKNGDAFINYTWMGDTVTIEVVSTGETQTVIYDNQKVQRLKDSDTVYVDFVWSGDNFSEMYYNDELKTEYHGYDQNYINPDYYLKSIELEFLQTILRPISKHPYKFKTDQPWSGDDFSVPLRTYEFFYEYDEKNRVKNEHNDVNRIYTTHFIYYD